LCEAKPCQAFCLTRGQGYASGPPPSRSGQAPLRDARIPGQPDCGVQRSRHVEHSTPCLQDINHPPSSSTSQPRFH
jgi:hypothetical protein